MKNFYAQVFVDIGWVPTFPLGFVTMEKVKYYYENGEQHKSEKLLRRIAQKVYNDDIVRETFELWKNNDLLTGRIHILNEAIEAHVTAKYYSSVLLFLTQIEGFLFDATNFKGWAKQEKVKKILGREEHFHMFADALKRFADVFLYEHFLWGNEYKSELSRNAILHGESLRYGTKINSLKLFMFFDVIQSAFIQEDQ